MGGSGGSGGETNINEFRELGNRDVYIWCLLGVCAGQGGEFPVYDGREAVLEEGGVCGE